MGTPKSSIHRWFFHYKPSILGHHHLWNPPYRYCSSVSFCHSVPIHPVKPRSISTRNWGEERQRPHRHHGCWTCWCFRSFQHCAQTYEHYIFVHLYIYIFFFPINYYILYITINDNSELFMFVFAWEHQIIAFVSGVRLVRSFLNTRHWKLRWRRSAGQHLRHLNSRISKKASHRLSSISKKTAISE